MWSWSSSFALKKWLPLSFGCHPPLKTKSSVGNYSRCLLLCNSLLLDLEASCSSFDYLGVSVGQKSMLGLVGSSTSRPLTRPHSSFLPRMLSGLNWEKSRFKLAHIMIDSTQSSSDSWTSSFLLTGGQPVSGSTGLSAGMLTTQQFCYRGQ